MPTKKKKTNTKQEEKNALIDDVTVVSNAKEEIISLKNRKGSI